MSKEKIGVAIVGPGNIGIDLMYKIMNRSKKLELKMVCGRRIEGSKGMGLARQLGFAVSANGVDDILRRDDIQIVFDATTAAGHAAAAPLLEEAGKFAVDLTPAAVGPYCCPAIALEKEHASARNVNLITCGGQATIPMVAAVSRVAKVHYGEIIASIASKSAGPGTRANIDEFTETTSKAIEVVGGATKGKAIIIMNPAEPPLIVRDTVYTLSELADEAAIAASVEQMAAAVQSYVPGYRLKQKVQFDRIDTPIRIPGVGDALTGLKTSIFLEVEGAAHYLPAYAGNLDIMTSAGLRTAEHMAERMLANHAVAA